MISMVVLVVGIPLTFAIFMLQHEGRNLFYELQRQVFSGHLDVPQFIRDLPIIGKEAQGAALAEPALPGPAWIGLAVTTATAESAAPPRSIRGPPSGARAPPVLS